MQAVMIDRQNKPSPIEVSESLFNLPFNEGLIHQVVNAYMAGARAGTKAQKTRSEVSGGGRKPWRQKGTGRARAGTIRSPLWRTGGKIFAARPRDFTQKVNRKMYRYAMASILSELFRQEQLVIIESLALEEPRTRHLVNQLTQLHVTNALLVLDEIHENLFLAARNLPHIELCPVERINPASLLAFERVVVTQKALQQIEQQLTGSHHE